MNSLTPAALDGLPTTRWTLLQQIATHPPGSLAAQRARQELRELYGPAVRDALRRVVSHRGNTHGDHELDEAFFTYLTSNESLHGVTPVLLNFRLWLKQQLLEFCRRVADESAGAIAATSTRSAARRHPACGALLPPDIPADSCPTCLLKLALPPSALPHEIGGFEIVDQIGAGGMAIVYEAYDPDKRINIALKVMRPELRLNEAELDLFRAGMWLAARLRHPNILPIEDGRGIRHDPPFFAMPLIEGGSLADESNRERFRAPEQAMRLMIEIANAVHCAHMNNVIHRDLKPGNVLIDTTGRSYVTDFGVATLTRPGAQQCSATIVGTLGYMSPEHVHGTAGAQADVYSLGAILYYLLTGAAPHQASDWQALREQFENPQTAPPPAPRRQAPEVSRDLDAVCTCALEADPTRRYRSAADFALDLHRVLTGNPPQPPNRSRPGMLRRFNYWCRRQPILAAGSVLGALLLFTVDAMMLQSVSSQTLNAKDVSLQYNVDLAAEKANRVLAKLSDDARKLAQMALDPQIQVLSALATTRSPAFELIKEGAPASDSSFLVDPRGVIKAHWPGPHDPGYFLRDFSFRDYFRCAQELRRTRQDGVCLSRVFEADKRITGKPTTKFALSTNVYAPDGRWLGVLVATHNAAPELQDIAITSSYSGQITSLLGPQDLPEGSSLSPDELPLTTVIHDQVEATRIYPLEPHLSRRLQQRFPRAAPGEQFEPTHARPERSDDYHDPVPGFDQAGLAGFAGVGRTGYVVAVYTPKSAALGALEQLLHTQAMWTLILNGGLLLLAGVGIARSLRAGAG